jgi:hypothetical protein
MATADMKSRWRDEASTGQYLLILFHDKDIYIDPVVNGYRCGFFVAVNALPLHEQIERPEPGSRRPSSKGLRDSTDSRLLAGGGNTLKRIGYRLRLRFASSFDLIPALRGAHEY